MRLTILIASVLMSNPVLATDLKDRPDVLTYQLCNRVGYAALTELVTHSDPKVGAAGTFMASFAALAKPEVIPAKVGNLVWGGKFVMKGQADIYDYEIETKSSRPGECAVVRAGVVKK